jgi:hypothetical protein
MLTMPPPIKTIRIATLVHKVRELLDAAPKKAAS